MLVVDDDPNELRTMVIGLRLEGFDAVGAADGTSALKLLQESTYSLILIDLMMPEMNGLQLARAVRSSFPAVLTILMSAYHLSPVQISRADAGVVGFVPKPFRFEELVLFIRSKLEPKAADASGWIPSAVPPGLYSPFEIPQR